MTDSNRKLEIRKQCNEEARRVSRIVGFSAWYEHAKKVLSPDEFKEVIAVWDGMPGSTCLVDAFIKWMSL